MTPKELYKLLDEAGVEYEVIEIFEGVRLLSFELTEEEEE